MAAGHAQPWPDTATEQPVAHRRSRFATRQGRTAAVRRTRCPRLLRVAGKGWCSGHVPQGRVNDRADHTGPRRGCGRPPPRPPGAPRAWSRLIWWATRSASTTSSPVSTSRSGVRTGGRRRSPVPGTGHHRCSSPPLPRSPRPTRPGPSAPAASAPMLNRGAVYLCGRSRFSASTSRSWTPPGAAPVKEKAMARGAPAAYAPSERSARGLRTGDRVLGCGHRAPAAPPRS